MNGFMKYTGLLATLLCVNSATVHAAPEPADVLVSWNLDGLSRDGTTATLAKPTAVHAGVDSSDLTFSSTLEATAWSDSLTVYAKGLMGDLKDAVLMGHYYSFTVTPEKGRKVSYSGIFNRATINTGNMATGASVKFVLMSSATGFAPVDELAPLTPLDAFVVVHPSENDKATSATKTFDVSAVEALQNVGEPVEFRIYAVLVDGVGNRMGFGHIFYQDKKDDLRVMGTVE
jgi:hypothetical protein